MTKPEQMERATDELVKQSSVQAALLAGFAFAGITSISYDASTSWWLLVAFGGCSSLAFGLELLALFMFGLLTYTKQLLGFPSHDVLLHDPRGERLFVWQSVALYSYLLGMVIFLAAFVLLAWIKIRPAAIPITVIALLFFVGMAVSYFRIISIRMRR